MSLLSDIMRQRLILLLILATALLQRSSASAASLFNDTTRAYLGEFEFGVRDDTLTITYEFTPNGFDPDSTILELVEYRDWNRVVSAVIHRRGEGVPFENGWRSVARRGGRTYLSGTVTVPADEQSAKRMYVSTVGFYRDENDSLRTVETWGDLTDDYTVAGMECILPSYGYFRSDLTEPFDHRGAFLGMGVSLGFAQRHTRYLVSTSWSGLGPDFTFSEPFRAGVRWYSGTRSNFMPQIFGAAKLSKLKFRESDDLEFNRTQWGGELGCALEGRFERFGYYYSTALGGYHTAEIYVKGGSGARNSIGTRYLFQTNGDVWMVRIALHIEDYDAYRHSEYERYNDRPLPHRVFSVLGGIPTAIIGLPFYVINKVAEKFEK